MAPWAYFFLPRYRPIILKGYRLQATTNRDRSGKFVAETPFKYHFLRYNQYGVLRANWPLKFCL
ncbi:MAG: hypothetical protein CFH04_00191, partial [Alphaproteobacteria bacterium MarineAlpha3_Bin3]